MKNNQFYRRLRRNKRRQNLTPIRPDILISTDNHLYPVGIGLVKFAREYMRRMPKK